jgi:histidyl-tRNA synthetase
VYVAHASAENHAYSIGLALNLRDHGIASDFALQPTKLAKQFAHADRLGFRYVVTVGADEEKAQALSIKELATGAEQKMLALPDALAVLRG